MRQFFIAAMLCFISALASAQSSEGFIVSAGDQQAAFTLSEVSHLTFGDATMTVHRTNGTTYEFQNADNWSFKFGTVTTAINLTIKDPVGAIEVYDINGRRVATVNPGDADALNRLAKGIYIIRANESTKKVIR